MLLPVTPHQCSVSKRDKLIGSPVGALVELFFGLSSGPYEERIDFVKCPQGRNSQNIM